MTRPTHHRPWRRVIGWMAVVALAASACSSGDTGLDTATEPGSTLASSTSTLPDSTSTTGPDLLVSTPEEQGIDSTSLAAFVDRVVADGGIDSVTVVRNGHVVLDTTVYPFPPGVPHIVHSVLPRV